MYVTVCGESDGELLTVEQGGRGGKDSNLVPLSTATTTSTSAGLTCSTAAWTVTSLSGNEPLTVLFFFNFLSEEFDDALS